VCFDSCEEISDRAFSAYHLFGLVSIIALPATCAVHWNSAWQADGFLPKYLTIGIVLLVELIFLWLWHSAMRSPAFQAWFTVPWLRVPLHLGFGFLCCIGPYAEILMPFLNG
jgi:phosphoglycerol transferase MdoB-like AlkP superfamily enzyme